MGRGEWWCPNCQRAIRPKRSFRIQDYLFAAAAYFALPLLLAALGSPYATAWWPGFVAAIVVGMLSAQLRPNRSCPICKSRNLQERAPPGS